MSSDELGNGHVDVTIDAGEPPAEVPPPAAKRTKRGPLTLGERLSDMREVQLRKIARLRERETRLTDELSAFRTSLQQEEAELARLESACGQQASG